MRASLIILSCSLAAVTAIPVHAQNAQSVRLGEAALTYAAGSIRQEMPIDGVINVITGDNQLSGNRMMLGWSGTDTLYLKFFFFSDAATTEIYNINHTLGLRDAIRGADGLVVKIKQCQCASISQINFN